MHFYTVIFSQILRNENKQQLYKIQKRPTSLFYHVLLIKQNECMIKTKSTSLSSDFLRSTQNFKKSSLWFVHLLSKAQ